MSSLRDIAKDITGESARLREATLKGREYGRQKQLEETALTIFGGETNIILNNISRTLEEYHKEGVRMPNRSHSLKPTSIEIQYSLIMNFLEGFKKMGITLVGYDEETGLQTVTFDPIQHANLDSKIKPGDRANVWKVGIALNGVTIPDLRPLVIPITN